jgi:hypothetical protein
VQPCPDRGSIPGDRALAHLRIEERNPQPTNEGGKRLGEVRPARRRAEHDEGPLGREDLEGATGRSIGCGAISGMSPSSAAMSSGNSRCTGPRRSSCAIRNASRTRVGMLAALTTCRAIFVKGRTVATTSTIWKAPCRLLRIGFWPVIMIIGIAPRCAYAAPVVRLRAPGPSMLLRLS